MVLINNSAGMILGQVIAAGAENVGGNIFIIMMVLFIFLLAMCMLFGIPLEFTALLVFPFVIAVATYEHNFQPLLIVFLFYFTFILTKRFIFR